MVLAEELWLEAAYGEPYRRYCNHVPRFFHWRRAAVLARAVGRRLRRKFLPGPSRRVGEQAFSVDLPQASIEWICPIHPTSPMRWKMHSVNVILFRPPCSPIA